MHCADSVYIGDAVFLVEIASVEIVLRDATGYVVSNLGNFVFPLAQLEILGGDEFCLFISFSCSQRLKQPGLSYSSYQL